ncbi:hypothetical protein H5410_016407, partial [Solanum commersonii]
NAKNSKSFNGEISEPEEIINRVFFYFHAYENNLLPTISLIVILRLWIVVASCFKPLAPQFNMSEKLSSLKQLQFVQR